MTVDPSQTTSSPSQDDFALLESVAARDPAALEALYNRHSPAVFALCARIVGDRVEAEDVLIDVFDQIWTRGAQFDPARGAPLTYILTIARSRALDHRRSRRSRGTPASDGSGHTGSQPVAGIASGGPVDQLLATEAAQRVRAAMAQLEPGQRRAIELSFFEGLSHAQIAEKLSRPLGTVKTIIRQGLIQLRQCVRTPGGAGPEDR